MFKRLLSAEDWDFVMFHFNIPKQPFIISRKDCTITEEDNTIVIDVSNSMMPFEREKGKPIRANAQFYFNRDSIASVEYYTEKKIVTAPNAGKLVTIGEA